MTLKSNIDDVTAKFKKIFSTLGNKEQALLVAGEILIENTRGRLARGIDVNGQPFQPLTALTIANKNRNADKVLIEHGDLYRELHYQLVNGGRSLEFGSDRKYAAIHQFGGLIKPKNKKALRFKGTFAKQVKIPKREFLGVTPHDANDVLQALADLIEK